MAWNLAVAGVPAWVSPFEKGNGGDRQRSPTRSFLVLGVEGQPALVRRHLPREKDVIAGRAAASVPADLDAASGGGGGGGVWPRGRGRNARPTDTRHSRNAAGCRERRPGRARSSRAGRRAAAALR